MESGRTEVESAPEANGKTTKGPVVATYKSLPEDSNWQETADEKPNAMVKKAHEMDLDDGAKEKMLNEESSINPNKSPTEVIFISENGDAKIDIENVKQLMSGMGKEELMKYANDPFWVRLRWMLFIGFWVIWFAMLIGAVAIIVLAPKCAPRVEKKWWEKSPLVQIEPHDIEGKDDAAINRMFEDLRDAHVQSISFVSLLEGTPDAVTNFTNVNPKIVSMERIEKIFQAAKDNELHIILEFDPNHSGLKHEWFNKSVQRIEPYTNYYVWINGTGDPPQALNNWKSVNGSSAWTRSPIRGQFYLHQLDAKLPDFNFKNPAVVEEFNKIFKFWMNRGVSGFRLGTTRYLNEDPALRDEPARTQIPANSTEYQTWVHTHTEDEKSNLGILESWWNTTKNGTDGVFTLRDDITPSTLAYYNSIKPLIDLQQSSNFFTLADSLNNATVLQRKIYDWFSTKNVSWPSWDVNGRGKSLRERVSENVANNLILMTMLLPGTPVVHYKDILPIKESFKSLAKERTKAAFLYGNFSTYVINDTVFVYTSMRSGSPAFLVAYQTGNEDKIIDVSNLSGIPEEVTRLALNLNETEPLTYPSRSIPVKAKSTVVVTFAPKED